MVDRSDDLFAANRAFWDRSTSRKMATGSYPLESFLAGESTLFDHEREEVGNVANDSLLHLQCNNGLESLSWVRAGADVVGVDLSGKSLRHARDLAEQVGLDAAFVQGNVYDVGTMFDTDFDVIYTARGVLVWLPDLDEWAQAIVDALAADGTFYLFDGHPMEHVATPDGSLAGSYFETEPRRHEEAAFGADEPHYRTHHGLGAIVSALADAGLHIEFVHEFPFHYWQRWDDMITDEQGRWTLPDETVPLTFSLRATPR